MQAHNHSQTQGQASSRTQPQDLPKFTVGSRAPHEGETFVERFVGERVPGSFVSVGSVPSVVKALKFTTENTESTERGQMMITGPGLDADHRVYDAHQKKASDRMRCAAAVNDLIEARRLAMRAQGVLSEYGCAGEQQAALKAAGLSSVTVTHGPCGCKPSCRSIVTKTVMEFELAGGMDIGIEWAKQQEGKA